MKPLPRSTPGHFFIVSFFFRYEIYFLPFTLTHRKKLAILNYAQRRSWNVPHAPQSHG